MNQYQQTWVTYRATCEALKHEKFTYIAKAGVYSSAADPRALLGERIETIGELVARSEAELLKVRNFGKTSLREVKKKLSDMGLNLGMDLESIFGKKTPPLV